MSFSTGLQSKIVRIWDAASITTATDGATYSGSWTDSVSGDVATQDNIQGGSTTAVVTYQANAFGSHPGLYFVGYPPVCYRTSADIAGVVSYFALVNVTSEDQYAGDTNGNPTLVGLSDNTFRGGPDGSEWIFAIDHIADGVVAYEDGLLMGNALARRTYPVAIGVVLPTAKTVQHFGGFVFGSAAATLGAFILLNAAPTQSEANELTTYLHGLGGTSPEPHPHSMQLYFGDSLTSGGSNIEGADGLQYPAKVAQSIGLQNLTYQNYANFGDTASGCLSIVQGSGAATISAAVAAGYTDIECFVFIGRNNIYNGGDPNTTATTVQSICTALRTAGATRIVLMTLPASDGGANQAAYDANRATFNANLVAMVPTYVDAIVRLDQDPQMGPNGSQTNMTYFVSDGIHFAPAGISRVASDIETQGIDYPSSSSSSLSSQSSESSQSSHSSQSSNSSTSSDSSSPSSQSSQSSVSSNSSSSSSDPQIAPSNVINGDVYLYIAQQYAQARTMQLSAIDDFYEPADILAKLNQIQPTLDLLQPFYQTYLQANAKLGSTGAFETPVRTLQSHVLTYGGEATVAAYIEKYIIGNGLAAGIPEEWAVLSKAVGVNIDSVIDPATIVASSSTSSGL